MDVREEPWKRQSASYQASLTPCQAASSGEWLDTTGHPARPSLIRRRAFLPLKFIVPVRKFPNGSLGTICTKVTFARL